MLDSRGLAQSGLWYVLSPENDSPSARVGHTCCVKKERESANDCGCQSLVITGGANPDGAFNDAYLLDFEKYAWCKCDWSAFPERYEHSAFIPEHEPNEIVIFGGATKDKNLNDVQILDTETNCWCVALPSGKPPSERTCHSAAAIGNCLFIFGGGENGAEPVQDDKLHVYNAKENSWSDSPVNGPGPQPRHGHVMVAVENSVFIHGGMAGTNIFGDLWQLKINGDQMTWSQPVVSGEVPGRRAAHAGCAVGSNLYIFGGMNATGAMDDLFCLNTESFVWQRIKCEGPPPNSRLDHTICAVTIPRETDGTEVKPTKFEQTFLIVFGGMDTRGEIFDDCLAFLVD